ncbi:PH domain-containing protein [Jatrophihabitans telluris]|uniref:PH domain-containing protein n=1 Tax=Jatrophihabitans telluris TaxID=2038343 RepID=A0ABY4R2S7_9ACTN|nr:PH domain-containing protein [Jatrophihabitans telluris]UQX90094.1 PH domain-containing protein [Jatrophihabitans telluris]
MSAVSDAVEGSLVVRARPIRSARIATVFAVVVLLALSVVAIILPRTADGTPFTGVDQFGVFGVGVLIAVGILSFHRPRLRADAAGVDTRGFLGGFKHVDWDLVVAVEFPPKVRFARLVLPGDELVPLYAVQRGDGDHSVEVMDGLRSLHARYGRGARGAR